MHDVSVVHIDKHVPVPGNTQYYRHKLRHTLSLTCEAHAYFYVYSPNICDIYRFIVHAMSLPHTFLGVWWVLSGSLAIVWWVTGLCLVCVSGYLVGVWQMLNISYLDMHVYNTKSQYFYQHLIFFFPHNTISDINCYFH